MSLFEFNRLKFSIRRDGDRFVGSVMFPYTVAGRTIIPIEYRRAEGTKGQGDEGTKVDVNAARRLDLLERFRSELAQTPGTTLYKRQIAKRLGKSVRTFELWRKRLETHGPDGLCDNYAAAPPRVLACTSDDARNACIICAWWAFRVGNLDQIDHKAMHAALSIFVPSSLRPSVPSSRWLAAILATIDCYYRAKIDRQRFPFKPFAKWCKYPEGFRRWLYIACDEEEWRARCREARAAEVPPIRSPIHVSSLPSPCRSPDIKERRRQTLNRPTRQAIESLADSDPSSLGPSVPSSLLPLPDTYRLLLIRAASKSRGWLEAAKQAQETLPVWYPDLPADVQQDIEEELAAAVAADSSIGRSVTDAELNCLRWPLVMARIKAELDPGQAPNPAEQIAV